MSKNEYKSSPTIDAKTFEDVDRSIPVYVPYGSKTSYENDPY